MYCNQGAGLWNSWRSHWLRAIAGRWKLWSPSECLYFPAKCCHNPRPPCPPTPHTLLQGESQVPSARNNHPDAMTEHTEPVQRIPGDLHKTARHPILFFISHHQLLHCYFDIIIVSTCLYHLYLTGKIIQHVLCMHYVFW